jgi:quercetin dioxygenase-like cupin family protein
MPSAAEVQAKVVYRCETPFTRGSNAAAEPGGTEHTLAHPGRRLEMPARKLSLGAPASDTEAGCLPIVPAPSTGWAQLAMGEWTLAESGWTDRHPFDELNYVLEGRLLVECDGEVLEAGPGETIQVFAGSAAHYHAAGHARMIYVYGPNPTGEPSEQLGDPTANG